MRFSVAGFTSALVILASGAEAAHQITLKNNCSFGVGLLLHNWSGTPYTGAAINSVGAKSSKVITVPDGWNGRICDTVAAGGCANSCYGKCSMTEFNMNAGGLNYYDISNIQAYTVPQAITSSCGTVTCTSATCPCNQAYRPGDISGTCGGTGPVDQAVRACAQPNFTITYCP